MPAAAGPSHADPKLEHLKRRLYGGYVAVAFLGALALWIVPPLGSELAARVVGVVVPPGLVALSVAGVLLWRVPTSVTVVERLLFVTTLPIFLAIPVATVAFGGGAEGAAIALGSMRHWVPLALVWAFVAFGSRGGSVASAVFLAAVGTTQALIARFVTPATTEGPPVPVVDVEAVVASASLVVLLFTFATILERQTRARTAAEAEARFALVDPLTGLWNRRALEPHLDATLALARRDGRSVAVYFVDLDGLKGVNDTFGHAGGDAVLVQYATRLGRGLRESDAVARIGGDEFAVVALVHDGEEARALADKLRAVTAQPFEIGGDAVPVTSSIGVSVAPEHGSDGATLLARADAAMYRSKAAGRDRWSVAVSL